MLLTTERLRRAEKLGVPEDSLSIRYASFYSLCKAVEVGKDLLYIEPTLEEMARYSRIWGETFSHIRVVVETFFIFREDMPRGISSWGEAIPYIETDSSNALGILNRAEDYRLVSTIQRPYVDRDRKRRVSVSHNSRKDTILTHHIKQWASNWGPLQCYLTDNYLYGPSISPIDSVEFITRGRLPNASPISYTMQETLANSIALSK